MGISRVILLLLAASISKAWATDSYCVVASPEAATYHTSAMRDCGVARQDTVGLCTETSKCVYFTDGFKAAAMNTGVGGFSALDDKQKEKFVSDNKLEWVPASFDCRGKIVKNDKGELEADCPPAEICKNDPLEQPMTAEIKTGFLTPTPPSPPSSGGPPLGRPPVVNSAK